MPDHEDGCPLAKPGLYDPDEGPLECICPDLRADAEPECNGICVWASELIECAPNVVAYPHPDCELHGAPGRHDRV